MEMDGKMGGSTDGETGNGGWMDFYARLFDRIGG